MFLVIIEGPDKSGKTTQASLLHERLVLNGHKTVLLREPGSTELGERIRQIVLSEDISPTVAALLFSASRRHMIETVVAPAIESGCIVILDRFYYSQLVYQSAMPLHENRSLCFISGGIGYAKVNIGLLPVIDVDKEDTTVLQRPADAEVVARYKELFYHEGFFRPTGTIQEVSDLIFEYVTLYITTLSGPTT